MKRLTYEFVKEQFEKEGYELLSKEYVNNRTKLKYRCPKGHEHAIKFGDWKQNRRCPICSREKGVDKRRIPLKFIRTSFKKENYILLSTEYKNCEQKLDYICSKGHRHSISWHNWKSGWRCPICQHERLSILLSGENHPNWKGGIACEPYCPVWLDKGFKKSILERDNYQCQNPDCWGTGSKLTGHHIDYNKKNCDPFNIITICDSCNTRANFNREYWKKFYKKIMEEKILIKEVFNYGERNSLDKI